MPKSSICNGHLNLDTGFNCDRGYLLNHIRGTVEVNDSFVYTQLKSVSCVGAFTTGGFSGGDVKNFSWHPNRSLHPEMLVLGTTNQVSTNLLEILDVLRGKGDSNLMDLLL
uniref:Uncharacterized protein n=1 Tax=Glycine max TaxID=3847 RepID=C6SZD8_SOYBN|nr:unknown [Glycine max]